MIYNDNAGCIQAALGSGIQLTVSMISDVNGRLTASANLPGTNLVGSSTSRAIRSNDFTSDLILVCSEAIVDLVTRTLAEQAPNINLVPAEPIGLIPADDNEGAVEIPLVPAGPSSSDLSKHLDVQSTVDQLIRFVSVSNSVSE